jgi:hypothetical protein
MDVAELRKRIMRELERPGHVPVKPAESGDRRATADRARRDFERLLDVTIVPILKQTADILRAEGSPCKVHTPSDAARLAFDKSSEDFVEFMLDTTPPPHVIGRSSAKHKKAGTLVEDRIVGVGRDVDEITDEDIVAFLLPAIARIVK